MKDFLKLTAGIAAAITACLAFVGALAAGFGAFTPTMNPWWLIVTIPVGLIVASGIVATAIKVVQRIADR